MSLFSISDIVNSAIAKIILYIQGLVMGFIGTALAWTAYALAWFLKFQGGFFEEVAIVKTSWEVFRNFANMFFILILIIIAFATIFDIQNYNWKGLMAKFIVAALLINFSLAIGGFLIDVSNNLSNLVLNQFGDITSDLAGGFGITKLGAALGGGTSSIKAVLEKSAGDPEALALGVIISLSGMLIVAVITLLSMLAALVFSMIRVPILWALLIVSPLAWITGILPNTREFNKKWWNWFIGWTFFLPTYLFALMMGIAILKGRPDLSAAAVLAEQASGPEGLPTRAANFFGFAFQDVFYWGLTVIILIGGLAASLKASFAAGSGATKAFGNISGTINNWAKRKAYIPAIQKAGKEKLAEIQDTGLQGKVGRFLYGGERAERLRAARVAGLLGKKEAMSEAEAAEVQKNYAKYKAEGLDKDKTALDALNKQIGTGSLSKFQELAARKLRAENGWVAEGKAGETEIEETIRTAGENSKFAQEYVDALKKNGFEEALGSQAQAEDLAKRTTILPLKKAILETMIKNNQILSDTMAEMVLGVFKNDSKAVKDEIEKGLQKNIKNFSDTKKKNDRAAYLLDASKNKGIKRILARQMSEDGEINTYQKYKTAAELFGGENETESRDMLNKIIKDKPLGHADILFRQKLAKAEADDTILVADYDPLSPTATTPAREKGFVDQIKEKLPKMGAKAIAETDIDIWERPVFETVLKDKIGELERKEPSKLGKTGGRGKAGAGKRYLLRIMKVFELDPNPEKEVIMERIIAASKAAGMPWP